MNPTKENIQDLLASVKETAHQPPDPASKVLFCHFVLQMSGAYSSWKEGWLKLVEEMAELTQAILKLQLKWAGKEKLADARENLYEELADIELVIARIKMHHKFDKKKLEQLKVEKARRRLIPLICKEHGITLDEVKPELVNP